MLICPPPGTGVLAQVIFGHPASGGQTTFFDEATALAKIGVRSWLLDFDFERNEKDPANLSNPQREIEFRKKCLLKIQEASILLGDRAPQIYIGKNFGAFVGGMAASMGNKISRYILIAGLPDLTNFYVSSDHPVAVNARTGVPKEMLKKYHERTHIWNPTQLLSFGKNTEIFFQFGDRDPWIPRETANQFIYAAKGPKTIKFYDDDHDLNCEQARLDRVNFIQSSCLPFERGVSLSHEKQ